MSGRTTFGALRECQGVESVHPPSFDDLQNQNIHAAFRRPWLDIVLAPGGIGRVVTAVQMELKRRSCCRATLESEANGVCSKRPWFLVVSAPVGFGRVVTAVQMEPKRRSCCRATLESGTNDIFLQHCPLFAMTHDSCSVMVLRVKCVDIYYITDGGSMHSFETAEDTKPDQFLIFFVVNPSHKRCGKDSAIRTQGRLSREICSTNFVQW